MSMDGPISRPEHEEFVRRMEDEHKRTNHRLSELEESVRQIGELTASVEKLAQSVQQMAKSQSRQEDSDEGGRAHPEWRGDAYACVMTYFKKHKQPPNSKRSTTYGI